MARGTARLTALAVSKLKTEGMHHDGGGLYLQVSAAGTRSWIFRYTLNGRARAMGLGPYPLVSLLEAREAADECRRLKYRGVDPISARKTERERQALEAARAVTFSAATSSYIQAHKAGWRNAKHADQWTSTLKAYVEPHFGDVPVQDVDVALVLKALEPIWTTKTETAKRVRQRIESVLDWATARGLRTGENPARWRGHLDSLLPAPTKVRQVRHHPALPFAEVPAFLTELRKQEGVAAMALGFLILTATRTSETIGARWSEIDLGKRLWVIPGNRIKTGREHRIPLSRPAMVLLKRLHKVRSSEYVFPGVKAGRPLSNMAILALLRRMEREDLTAHGFRSTFRDWAAECTSYPREVAEMALAHAISDKVEAAYRRGDLFEKRRALMADWASYCRSRRSGA